MSRTGGPEGRVGSDRVTVRLAAFGTQFNGRDVRLLASPADGSLSGEARASIEAFFYIAWKASHLRTTPYFAFIPLDHDDPDQPDPGVRTWGLMQVVHLGRATAGDVVVAWAALLDRDQLHAIDWATHRLLNSAFPDVSVLPEVNTRLAARDAVLAVDGSVEGPYAEAFDRVVQQLFPEGRRLAFGQQVAVSPPGEAGLPPLTPETALFGIWERLGGWREDHSYCTWSGLEAFIDGKGGVFRLTLGLDGQDALRPDAIPLGSTTDGAPLPPVRWGWESLRQANAGVTRLADIQDDLDLEARRFAELEWKLRRETIRDGAYRVHWANLARTYVAQAPGAQPRIPGHPLYRPALQYLLELALADLPPPERRTALEFYIADILPLLPSTAEDRNPTHTVAAAGLRLGAVHDLSDAALAALEPALFDMPEGEHDLSGPLLEALAAQPPQTVNWPAFITALRSPSRGRPLEDRIEMMIRVAGLAWAQPRSRVAVHELIAELVDEPGVTRAVEILSRARPADRRDIFVEICGRRPGRNESRLKSWPDVEAAMLDAFLLMDAGRTLMNLRTPGRV